MRQLLRLLVKRQPAVVVHKPDCEHHIAAPPFFCRSVPGEKELPLLKSHLRQLWRQAG